MALNFLRGGAPMQQQQQPRQSLGSAVRGAAGMFGGQRTQPQRSQLTPAQSQLQSAGLGSNPTPQQQAAAQARWQQAAPPQQQQQAQFGQAAAAAFGGRPAQPRPQNAMAYGGQPAQRPQNAAAMAYGGQPAQPRPAPAGGSMYERAQSQMQGGGQAGQMQAMPAGLMGGMMSDRENKEEIARLEGANDALSRALYPKPERPDTSELDEAYRRLGHGG